MQKLFVEFILKEVYFLVCFASLPLNMFLFLPLYLYVPDCSTWSCLLALVCSPLSVFPCLLSRLSCPLSFVPCLLFSVYCAWSVLSSEVRFNLFKFKINTLFYFRKIQVKYKPGPCYEWKPSQTWNKQNCSVTWSIFIYIFIYFIFMSIKLSYNFYY